MMILVVEDELKLARALELELEFEGYHVELCHDGEQALTKILQKTYAVIILDVMLPDLGGMDVLRRLRSKGCLTPVILLTAKDQTNDKVLGLDYGANDYMTKPFEIEELLARIRVQIRESNTMEKAIEKNEFVIDDIVISLNSRQVIKKGIRVRLTKREFDLISYLVRHKNQALSRELLLTQVWGYDYLGETNVVDVYVRYLRQKLGCNLIETIRGVGYMVRSHRG